MLVKIFGEYAGEVELEVKNIPQVLAGIKHMLGADIANFLADNKHYYLLSKSDVIDSVIPLHPQMIASDISEYDTLFIVPDIGGEAILGAGAAVAAWFGAVGTAATAIAIAVDIAITIAISLALSAIVQLLSPTMSFDGDPAAAQKLDSALFNGAPNIREQGGSVPIIVGECHAGGVLISAGISSEEKTL